MPASTLQRPRPGSIVRRGARAAERGGAKLIQARTAAGRYNFALMWADERFRPADHFGGPEVETFPDLFIVFQDQLGLKLEVKKGPVEVLLVDNAEKGTVN